VFQEESPPQFSIEANERKQTISWSLHNPRGANGFWFFHKLTHQTVSKQEKRNWCGQHAETGQICLDSKQN